MYPQAPHPMGTYPVAHPDLIHHGPLSSHSHRRSKHARNQPSSPVHVTNNFHMAGGLEYEHGSRRHQSSSHSHAYDSPLLSPGEHYQRLRRQSLAPELPPLSPRSRHPLPHHHGHYNSPHPSPRHPSHPRHPSRSRAHSPPPPRPITHRSFLHPDDAYKPPKSPYARPPTPPLRPSRQHTRRVPPPLSPPVRHVRPSRIDDDDDDDERDEYGRFGRGRGADGMDCMDDLLGYRRDRGY